MQTTLLHDFDTEDLIVELSDRGLSTNEERLLKQAFPVLLNWQPAPDFIDLEEFDPSVFSNMEVQMKMEIISGNLGNRTVEEIKAFFEKTETIHCPVCGHECDI